jgi:hypothetical protein
MSLRNILVVCAAVVAAGGVAGLAMRPQGYQPQPQAVEPSSSNFADTRSEPQAAPVTSGGDRRDRQMPGDDRQVVSLSRIDQADRVLTHMPVENANGQRLGEVAQVTMDASGKAREVVLDQGSRIAADDLTFIPARSVLVTQTTPNDQAPDRAPSRERAPNYRPANGSGDFRPPEQGASPGQYPTQQHPTQQRPSERRGY